LAIEEQRVNVVADLVTPSTALGDWYRVEGRVVIWKADDVIVHPSNQLIDGARVTVVER
jgi:HlyD family secretion protein